MGDIEDLDYYLAMQEEQEAEAEPEPDFWEEENIPEQQPVNTTSIPVTNEAIDAKKTAQIGISSLIRYIIIYILVISADLISSLLSTVMVALMLRLTTKFVLISPSYQRKVF